MCKSISLNVYLKNKICITVVDYDNFPKHALFNLLDLELLNKNVSIMFNLSNLGSFNN